MDNRQGDTNDERNFGMDSANATPERTSRAGHFQENNGSGHGVDTTDYTDGRDAPVATETISTAEDNAGDIRASDYLVLSDLEKERAELERVRAEVTERLNMELTLKAERIRHEQINKGRPKGTTKSRGLVKRTPEIKSDHLAYIHQEIIQNWTLSDLSIRVYGLLKRIEWEGEKVYGVKQSTWSPMFMWKLMYAPRTKKGNIVDVPAPKATWRTRADKVRKALDELCNAGLVRIVHKQRGHVTRYQTVDYWGHEKKSTRTRTQR